MNPPPQNFQEQFGFWLRSGIVIHMGTVLLLGIDAMLLSISQCQETKASDYFLPSRYFEEVIYYKLLDLKSNNQYLLLITFLQK